MMRQFIEIFKKVNGKKVLKQYKIANVLIFALIQTITLGCSKKALEILRLAVDNKILCKLRKKYKKFIANYSLTYNEKLPRIRSNKIWICWFQGIDNAPDVVKNCYYSILNNIKDRDIILITEDNYRDYVEFPKNIQNKIELGIITKTHTSDLLRLELLNRYGGTWIDATVFCSGKSIPEYMLNSDLFLFQSLKPGLNGKCTCISSWFISACTNNPILLLTQSMLYDYWEKNDRMIDYFLLHKFFQIAIEKYPEEWQKVVPFDNSTPHILLLRLFEKYDEYIWSSIREQTCFHKISYKFEDDKKILNDTYYDVIIKKNK